MYSESRAIGYGLAASVVVHLCVFALVGIWVGVVAVPHIPAPNAAPEPEVTMLFARDIMVEPAPPPPVAEEKAPEPDPVPVPQKDKPRERYIRTTQNEEAEKAPDDAKFISDKNTVASAKLAPVPGGTPDMPTTKGIAIPTMELADRDYRDGETKNDSAPAAPPSKPQPPPQEPVKQQVEPPQPQPQPPAPMTPPEPPLVPQIKQPEMPPPPPTPAIKEPETPQLKAPQMAKKEDSMVEQQMKELEASLAKADREHLPIEMRKPDMQPDTPPAPKPDPQPQPQAKPMSEPPAEMAPPPPAPKAIPVAEPALNTPKPEKNAFQPHTRTSESAGTISNMGPMDSAAAAATPTGRYMRRVTGAIEKKWHMLRKEKADFVEPGKLRLKFFVNKAGRPEDISIVFNEANAVLTDFSLSAILLADIPPIPTDLLPILEKERVEMQYDIVIY